MASANTLPDLLARAASHFTKAQPLLPMYFHLILASIFPIYTGAHASLSRPASAAKPSKKTKQTSATEDEDEEEEQVQKMEGLSNSDAILLPVTAGLVLAGLYFLIMKYGADIINLIMGYYFAGVGVFSVAKLVNDATNVFLGFVFPTHFRHRWSLRDRGCLMRVVGSERKVISYPSNVELESPSGLPVPNPLCDVALPKWFRDATWTIRNGLKHKYTAKGYVHSIVEFCVNFTLINLLSVFVALAVIVYVNTISKPWYLTNLQGFAVSYSALQLLSPTTFVTGSLILASLFCYDIWAVFFTPLMVGVAKNLDQPIKLVFPRSEPSPTPGEPPIRSFSMLGLGDIVVPGIMIGLALRFDLYNFYLKKQKSGGTKTSVDTSTGEITTEEVIRKAPYVSVTGRWGDRFWTSGLPPASLPAQLRSSFPKPYFTASMIGYVSGMATTLGVMSVFNHAQPALLYLVPGVLLSLWGTALVKGEIWQMWEFTEAITAEPVEDDEDKKSNVKESKDEQKSSMGLFERLWQDLWHGGDKKDEAQKANESESSKARKDSEKATNEKDESDPGLLFSFVISRAASKTKPSSKTKQTKAAKDVISAKNHSPKLSQSSSSSFSTDDVVVVSSGDVDGTQEAESTPRYRTRSSMATTAEK